MRTLKTISSLLDVKSKTKKAKLIQQENELIHPRFEVRNTGFFGQKTSNSLFVLMYSKENEVLFI